MVSNAATYVLHSEWGTITFMEVDAFIAFIDSVYRYLTIGNTKSLLDDINYARTIYKRNHEGNEYGKLLNMRERVYRQSNILQAMEAFAPIPNVLIRNSFITKRSLRLLESLSVENFSEEKGYFYIPVQGALIADEFSNILRRPYVWYILDSIGSYINDYQKSDGSAEHITLETIKQADTNSLIRSYIIRDTFDNFCKRSCIQGEYRKQVKATLFPVHGTTGPLESVKVIVSHQKAKILTDMRFLRVRTVKTKSLSGICRGTIDEFCLELNADLFTYIEKSENPNKTKLNDHSNGYQWRTLGMTDKILRSLTYIRIMSTTPALKATLGFNLNRLDMNFYIPLVHYLLDRWHTGFSKRKSNMLVNREELQTLGLLPDYSHRSLSKEKEWMKQNMIVVSVLCNLLNERFSTGTRRLFIHCENIGFDEIDYSLCFSYAPASSRFAKKQHFPQSPRKMG